MFRLLELRHPARFMFDQPQDFILALISLANYSAKLKKRISKMVAVLRVLRCAQINKFILQLLIVGDLELMKVTPRI